MAPSYRVGNLALHTISCLLLARNSADRSYRAISLTSQPSGYPTQVLYHSVISGGGECRTGHSCEIRSSNVQNSPGDRGPFADGTSCRYPSPLAFSRRTAEWCRLRHEILFLATKSAHSWDNSEVHLQQLIRMASSRNQSGPPLTASLNSV